MEAKKVIKKVAKNTGKYTLKGIGKGIECLGKGGIKTIKALANNKGIQKIVTAAGIIAAGIAVPTVGIAAISALGIKYMIDGAVRGKNRTLMEEINDCLNKGTEVTRKATKKIVNPMLRKAERGIGNIGKKYQGKIDGLFR